MEPKPKPLPSDRRTLEAIVAEVATAERSVAGRFTTIKAIESVGNQARSPIFRGPAAQAHLADEFARLRAAYSSDPYPSLMSSGPHVGWPDPGLPVADYLVALRHELIRLHRAAMAKLAALDAEQEKPKVDEALAATVNLLAGSRRGIEIVEYLARWEARSATLGTIAVDVYKRKTITADGLRTVRRQVERTAKRLDDEGAPLRLTIDANTVSLLATDKHTRCDTDVA